MEFNDECDECDYYVKPISNSSAWTCALCGMDEIEIIHDTKDGLQPFIWHRYKLQCGHEAHSRCYRVWCKKMDAVGCMCEIREKMNENLYCENCKTFGHGSSNCPIVRYLHVKQYILSSWGQYYNDYILPKK